MTKTCRLCGNTYEVDRPHRRDKSKFCSIKCCVEYGPTRQGLFIRRMKAKNKIRLSADLRDRCGERIRVTKRDGRMRIQTWGMGGGSRKLLRFGLEGVCIAHADLWKSMPDSRVYLAEVEPGVWEALA